MTLLRRLRPALPWIPWLPVAATIGVLCWGMTDLSPDFGSRNLYLRSGLLVVALGLCFALDDPAAPTTDSAPSPLRLRRALRLLWSVIPWTSLIVVLVWAPTNGVPDPMGQVPFARLLLEASTIGCCGLAIASVIAKRWDDEPGKWAAPGLLALFGVSWAIPEAWRPWALPGETRWATVLPWWWAVLAVSVGVVVVSGWDARRWRPLPWRVLERRAPRPPPDRQPPAASAATPTLRPKTMLPATKDSGRLATAARRWR